MTRPLRHLIQLSLTEEDGWLGLRGGVDGVQDLSGDGEAGPGATHREEQVVVSVKYPMIKIKTFEESEYICTCVR